MSRTRFHEDDELPPHDDVDALVIMGGLMNVYDYELYPWLVREKDYIWGAIEKGKTVLGVCLGAQLIADVLGGLVRRNRHKEIGWHPVRMTEDAAGIPFLDVLPREFMGFHWHGDTFDIPHDAVHIATSPACQNQGFVYRERVVGLQFHLEYSMSSLQAMVENCGDELVDAPFINGADEILGHPQRLDQLSGLLLTFLDALANGHGR